MLKPPLRTKSIGFKVSEEEYMQLETAAQTSGQTLGEWCREYVVDRELKAVSACGLPHPDWIAKILESGCYQAP